MQIKRVFLISVLCLVTAVANAGASEKAASPLLLETALDAALERGLKHPETPFQLQVNCIDQKGIRSMQLFAGGATIWNRRTQIMLPAKARSALIETLISHGYSGFEARYGGSVSLEKTEAPARMTCRVHVQIEDLKKSSVQQGGGEQSALLAGLATALLDQVEMYENSGVTPNNLQDALERLNSGQLAPQVLQLRFLDLSGEKGKTAGFISRIHGGEISHQAYSPGRSISPQAWGPLDSGQYPILLAGLLAAQLEELPGNLWSQDRIEFEIQLLGYKKVVIAKPFTRLDPGSKNSAQQRFASLVGVLRELNPQAVQP